MKKKNNNPISKGNEILTVQLQWNLTITKLTIVNNSVQQTPEKQ